MAEGMGQLYKKARVVAGFDAFSPWQKRGY